MEETTKLPEQIYPVEYGGYWDFNGDGNYESQSFLDTVGYPDAERLCKEIAYRYNNYQKGMLCLNVKFGVDQERGIDSLIKVMIMDGKIKHMEKGDKIGDYVPYKIFFDDVYQLYAFGHTQGRLASRLR
jgi:hypothetical protein